MEMCKIRTNELYHHGVKGQRWGIRNGPPYPIEDKVLQKGTRLNSVSLDKSKRLDRRWKYTYNPNDPWDSAVYKGAFAVYKTGYLQRLLYDHSYEVTKDLKMPTKKERVDEFIKMYGNKKLNATTVKDLSTFQKWIVNNPSAAGAERYKDLNVKSLKTPDEYKRAYELFNRGMEYSNQFKSTRAYSKIMSTKYDAMVDDNNQGIYNGVHDPVIIFKANKVLKEIGNVKIVSPNEIAENFTKVKTEMEKQGKPILL